MMKNWKYHETLLLLRFLKFVAVLLAILSMSSEKLLLVVLDLIFIISKAFERVTNLTEILLTDLDKNYALSFSSEFESSDDDSAKTACFLLLACLVYFFGPCFAALVFLLVLT